MMLSGTLTRSSNSIFKQYIHPNVGAGPRIVFCCQWQWTKCVAQLFLGRIHRVGNSEAHGEQM